MQKGLQSTTPGAWQSVTSRYAGNERALLTYQVPAKFCWLLPVRCKSVTSAELQRAVQIDMDITAVAGSFNEGADSVQWIHHR